MNSIRFFKRLVAALVVLLSTSIPSAHAQVTKTWNGSANTDWSNPTNWIPAGVPASNDTVNFSSGTINFTAAVTFSGQFNWSGGTLAGSSFTLTTNGVMNLTGAGSKAVQNAITNAGTITFSGSNELYVYNNGGAYRGVIYNLAGGLFDITGDRNINCGCYGGEQFHNAGVLRKSGGSGTSSIGVPVTNVGTVTTVQGTLNFTGGGILGGTYTAQAGTVVNFNNGAFSYQAGSLPQLNGPGNIRFSGGTLTLIDNIIPNLTLAGGTLTLGPNFQGGTITNLTTASVLSGNYSVSGVLNLGDGINGNLQMLSGSTVNWSGGSLSSNSYVAAGAVLNWSSGSLVGPLAIAANGAMNLSGGGTKSVQNALTNGGTITFSGSNELYVYNNGGAYRGVIYNLAGGLFDITVDRNINCGCYGGEQFHNAGVLRKSGGSGTSSIGIPVTNVGTVTTVQGTLNFTGGGSLGGIYTAQAGTVINFNNGAFSYQTGALPQLNGPGNIRFSGGTLTLIDNIIPNLTLAGGTLTLAPNFQGGTITNLTTASVLSGNYSVSGVLNLGDGINGNLQLLSGSTVNWSGGSLSSNSYVAAGAVLNWSSGSLVGPLTIAANGAMNLSGSGTKSVQNALTNGGTITFSGSNELYVYNNGGAYRGVIYNLAGGLFDITVDRNINCGCYGGEQFHNAGVLRKSGGSGTSSIGIPVSNVGTVTTVQGTLNFTGGGSLGGIYTAQAGTVINFNNGAFSYQAGSLPQLNGPGNIRFSGGTLTLIDNIIPNLTLAGGTLTLGPNFQGGTITNLTTASVLSGNYSVNGVLNLGDGINGNLQMLSGSTVNWSGGSLSSNSYVAGGAVLNWSSGSLVGPLTIAANGAMNLSGSGTKSVQNALTNGGTITFSGSNELYVYNNGGAYRGVIYNLAGGLFDITVDRNINCGCYGGEQFHNAGVLRKSGGPGTTSISVPFNNTGSLDVESGTLHFTVNSGYAQTNGTMIIGVSGTNNAGHVTFAGNVNLDGTLNVIPLNGYVPLNGHTLSLISYGSRAGIFNNLNLPSLSAGLAWQTIYNSNAVQLKVVTNGIINVPQLVAVSANYSSPVPATTNLVLSFRFDRSMQTSATPVIYLTNSAALVQPTVPPNGYWMTYAFANDTYITPGITLASGMDGTNRVFISGAMDLNSAVLPLANVLNLKVDATWPIVSNIAAAPAVQTALITWTTDEPATSLVEYGLTSAYGLTTGVNGQLVTAHGLTLNGLAAQTTYHFRVRSHDQAGNETVSGDGTFTTGNAPDLLVRDLQVTGSLTSGGNIVISWRDTNSGAGATYTYWYDQIVVTNVSIGQTLLNTVLLYDPTSSGQIPSGGSAARQLAFTLPNGSAGAGTLRIIITADSGNRIVEQNAAATGELNNTNSIVASSSLAPYPDLVVTNVYGPGAVNAGQTVQLIWTDTNLGNAPATNSWNDQVFLSNTNFPGGGQFLGTFTVTNLLAPGQSLTRTQAVTIPQFATGTNWFVVKGNAGGSFYELNTANNSAVCAQPVRVGSSLGLTLTPSTVSEMAGTNPVTGSVTRNGEISSPLTVNLSSVTGTNVVLPPTVVIAAGKYSANFQLTVLNNAVSGGSVTDYVLASAPGFATGSAPLTIMFDVPPELTLTLSAHQVAETALPGAATGTITRNVNLGFPLNVTLVSDLPTALLAPVSVMIPAGQASVSFPLTPVDDNLVGDTRRARISAKAAGYNPVTATMDVLNSGAALLKLGFADTSVPKGKASPATIGTVMRAPVSPAAQDVLLTVSTNSLLTVPVMVTIPANAASATFNVSVGDDNLATGTRIATMTAQFVTPSRVVVTNGQVSAFLTVLDTHGPSLSLSFAKSSIAKGSNTVGTITRNTSTATNLMVNLDAAPSAAVTFPPNVTIPTGQTSETFIVSGVLDNTFTGARKVEFTAASAGFNPGVGNLTVSDIYMPDLVPLTLNAPTNALTGQAITLSWVVANHGLSGASNSWYDVVYLATDSVGSSQLAYAYATNKSSLASGGSYTNQATFALPAVPGNYWIVIAADALNSVTEISKLNNSVVVSQPISINPLYSAAISNVTPSVAKSGTPVTFSGRTYFTADGSPAPQKNALIHLVVNGVRRLFNVNSDAAGNFSYTFQPLSNEAGDYTVGAEYPLVQADPVQAGFALIGMQALPGGLTAQLLPNIPQTNYFVLSNLTSHPLTGLTFNVPDLSSNLTAQFVLTNQTLPSNGVVTVGYVLQSPLTRSAQVRFSATVTSAEGAQLTIPASANVVPLVPQLVANPSFLTRGMLVGSQNVVSFDILNTGGASSGDLTLRLPTNFTWMTLSSPAIFPSIPAGGKATVTLTLNPPAGLALTLYSGNLAAVGDNTGVSVPFQFRAVSDGKGDLRVTTTDDYTYYVADTPKVENALVTVRDAITTAIIAQTNSDANGIAYFSGLPEGPYTVDATATKHNQFRGSASIVTGTTVELEAFMPRQLVTYQWTVVPTDIPDHYTVQLETVFETEVPVPNVVVEQPSVMLLVTPGEISQFDIKLTNQGLIAANGVRIRVPNHPDYIITPLVNDIGVIPAKSSVTVPVTVQSRVPPATPGLPTKFSDDGCDASKLGFHGCLPAIPLGVEYYYVCGPNNVLQQRSVDLSVACTAKSIYDCLKDLVGITGSENLRDLGCNTLTAFLSCAASQYGINLDPCVVMGLNIACGAATGGAAGAVSGGLGSLPDCICAHLDLIPLPELPHATPTGGGGDLLLPILPTGSYAVSGSVTATGILIPGTCNSSPAAPSATTASTISAHSNPLKLSGPIKRAAGGVCAKVRLRIEQNVIITRSAFQGTLEIDNGGTTDISNVQISLNFQDSTNGNAAAKFFIEGPRLRGLTAADGTGILAGGASGSAVYTFIPTINAAPDAPQSFQIGGTLSYIDNGEQVVVPLLSAPITVYPEARLDLLYFQQRDVYADDPFTDEIEPSEPFALGLLVKNTGAGNARNLTITSGQPQIIDNEKGLLVDFTIIGTRVGDQPVSPSLTARLGDISPGGTREVTWDMISSLQGRFISFNATFTHANELGGTNTSLINSVEIHELTHRVLANRTNDDSLADFLVNDIADPANLPDILYLSDGTISTVSVVTNGLVDAPAGPGHLQVQLTAAVSNGWNYIRLPDPGVGYRLTQVVRSDGKVLSLTNNAWITDRSFPSSLPGAIQENLLHLFDYAGNGSYSLYYGSTNTTPPAIVQVVGPTPFTQTGAVSSVQIQFSALVDTNTFRYTNVALTRNGGANLITSGAAISLTFTTNFTYSLNGLQTLTAADGNYQITVYGNGIRDLWGNNAGNVSASAAWAKGNSAVVVQTLAPVSPNPRNVPVGSTTVVFSRAINAATFDYSDVTLRLNGGANLINNLVVVSPVSSNTFTISGLGALTAAEGSYTLTVNATNIQDALGGGGFGAQSVSWTMITSAPNIAALEQVATNPRNIVVQSLNVSFSEPIDPVTFDYHDLTLTREGGPNLITSEVTVSPISPTVYKIGNINWVQGLAGTYTLAVNAAGISDLAGNSGIGSTNESWTMILGAPASPTNLVMTPDLGISPVDGLTSATTITMAGSVGASNLTVRVFDQTANTDLGTATVTGTNFSATLNFTITGQRKLKITAVDAAGNVSVPTYFDLFLDIVPPTAIIQQVTNPIYGAVSSVPVLFSELVNPNTISANKFVLTRDGTAMLIPTLTHVSSNLFLVGGISNFTYRLGNYQLRLHLAGVQDYAGNSSTNVVFMSWVRASSNVAPSIELITNRVVTPDSSVRFRVVAQDGNGDPLTFSLDPGAPATAKIKFNNGVFEWVPTRAYAATTNPITVRVTDNGFPSMSATQTFLLTVLDYLDLSLGSTNVQGGQTAEVPVYLASSEGVTNLLFNIAWPGERFTNASLVITAAGVQSNLFQNQFTNLLVGLQMAPGQALQSTQQIMKLRFTAVTNQTSAFVPLTFGPVQGVKPGNAGYSNYLTRPAIVAVVQDKPLLIAGLGTNQNRTLTLFGRLNEGYQLQTATTPSGVWQPLVNYTQTNSAVTISVNPSDGMRFYRLYRP